MQGQETVGAMTLQQRIGAVVAGLPPWSWATFLGATVGCALAGFFAIVVVRHSDGGAFAPKHRKELVAATVVGAFAGLAYGFQWLFMALGMR
jgi:hypothetical protein